MRIRVPLALLGLCFVTLGSPATAAPIHAYGAYRISGGAYETANGGVSRYTLSSGNLTGPALLGLFDSVPKHIIGPFNNPYVAAEHAGHAGASSVSGQLGTSLARLISLGSSTSSQSNSRYYGHETFAGVTGGFRDTIRFTGGGPPPATLQVTFHVDGTLTASHSTPNTSNGRADALAGVAFVGYDTLGGWLPGVSNPPSGAISWAAYSSTQDMTVDQTFSTLLIYDSVVGGYRYNLQAWSISGVSTYNQNQSGSANSDFRSTISLTGVFDANGNRIDASRLTFDSGLQFASATAVPEPASAALFALLAMPVIAGCARRHRKRAV